jgi:hypothetical protein
MNLSLRRAEAADADTTRGLPAIVSTALLAAALGDWM